MSELYCFKNDFITNLILIELQGFNIDEIKIIKFYLNFKRVIQKIDYLNKVYLIKEDENYICYGDNYKAPTESTNFNGFLSKINVWIIGYINKIKDQKIENKKIVLLHGSCCLYNKKVIIICGTSGSGKTTLLKNLINKGAFYISDDTIFFDYINGEIYPFLSCMRIKEDFIIDSSIYDSIKLDITYARPKKVVKKKVKPDVFLFLDKNCNDFQYINYSSLFNILLHNFKCLPDFSSVNIYELYKKLFENNLCVCIDSFKKNQLKDLYNILEE